MVFQLWSVQSLHLKQNKKKRESEMRGEHCTVGPKGVENTIGNFGRNSLWQYSFIVQPQILVMLT